jgi:subtilisin family serine protease
MKHIRLAISLLVLFFIVPPGSAFGFSDQRPNTAKMDFTLRAVVESTLLKENGGQRQQVCLTNLYSESPQFRNGEPVFNVIIYTDSPEKLKTAGIYLNSVFEHFSTSLLSLRDISNVSNFEEVKWIELGKPVYPSLDKSVPKTGASKLQAGLFNNTNYKGEGVIVGVYDTGIDWQLLDFRDDQDLTKSRILLVWDQTDSIGSHPSGYDYGVEYTNSQINSELKGITRGAVREQDGNGHGTHVAGIAAGDGSSSALGFIGMAPKADLIIVKGGEAGFNRARIIDGINYIINRATSLGKPVAVNLSIGGQEGAHDGTSAYETALNSLLNQSGRAIIVAAGNDGSNFIHAGAQAYVGQTVPIKLNIPLYTPSGGSVNDYVYFDMWYKGSDWLTVSVITPTGIVRTAISGSVNDAVSTVDGKIFIDNASRGSNPANNDKECIIQIFDQFEFSYPKDGTWTISVTGATVPSGGGFDIWIEEQSSSISGARFTAGGDNSKSVGLPGTAAKVITVGAFNTRGANSQGDTVLWQSMNGKSYRFRESVLDSISYFSSQGPTRDGRQKPDIAAPGSAIMSARSSSLPFTDEMFTAPDLQHFILQGTSMAAPHVAGAVALLFQIKPTLTSDEVKNLLASTALSDRFTGSALPDYVWGHGKVDVFTAAQSLGAPPVPLTHELDQNYPNPFNSSTTIIYNLASPSYVSLKVYDVLGREVGVLLSGGQSKGIHVQIFDSRRWDVASGVYFYRLSVGDWSDAKKMMLLK